MSRLVPIRLESSDGSYRPQRPANAQLNIDFQSFAAGIATEGPASGIKFAGRVLSPEF